MRSVKYVPADAQARLQFPTKVLIVRTCGNPFKGSGGKGRGERLLTDAQADREAYKNGWMRLSELSPRERAHWKSVYTIMAPAAEKTVA